MSLKHLRKYQKPNGILIETTLAESIYNNDNDNDVNLWKINLMQYSTVLTLLQRHNQLKENPPQKKKQRWLEFQQQKVNSIGRKVSYINLILQCRNHNTRLTKQQEKIQLKLKKCYRNTKTSTLISKATELKHELKVTSQYIKNKKNTG